MSTVFTKNYAEPPFNRKEILRYALCKDASESVNLLLDDCIAEIESKLSYRVCYLQVKKDILFKTANSELLDKYLADCDEYILFAATIGIEIDRLISKYSKLSPAKAHMLQAIGTERTEALCDMFECDMRKENKIKPRISPGYGDMPLDMQREVFAVLDCPRKIGLTLRESLIMSPSKSVTAIIGVLK